MYDDGIPKQSPPSRLSCPVCASSSYGKCATHRDPTVFRDRYFLTIDLDPDTEANIRADERHHVIDEVFEAMEEATGPDGYMVEPLDLASKLTRMRPSRPPLK